MITGLNQIIGRQDNLLPADKGDSLSAEISVVLNQRRSARILSRKRFSQIYAEKIR
jgi:hypothetical protein